MALYPGGAGLDTIGLCPGRPPGGRPGGAVSPTAIRALFALIKTASLGQTPPADLPHVGRTMAALPVLARRVGDEGLGAMVADAIGDSTCRERLHARLNDRGRKTLVARWDEIDLEGKIWTVPPARTKSAREHRVPLSDRAVAILREMDAARDGEYVFPGQRPGRPLSGMAFEMLLRRIGSPYTAHGFRSAFRDWAGNETHFPRELAEHALAHVIGDKAEQAYRRSDALARRRELMDAWARHCEGEASDNVLPFKRPA